MLLHPHRVVTDSALGIRSTRRSFGDLLLLRQCVNSLQKTHLNPAGEGRNADGTMAILPYWSLTKAQNSALLTAAKPMHLAHRQVLLTHRLHKAAGWMLSKPPTGRSCFVTVAMLPFLQPFPLLRVPEQSQRKMR